MKEVGDKRRGAHYYLTILSLIIMTIYFQQAMTTMNLGAVITTYLKAIFIVIIILFLTAEITRKGNKQRFKTIDLIEKTIKDIWKPGALIALIILLLNLLAHLIPLDFLGISSTEITLIILGTIAGTIIYNITK